MSVRPVQTTKPTHDIDIVISNIKRKASAKPAVLEKIRSAREEELERIAGEMELETARRSLQGIQGQNNSSVVSALFKDKSVEEINELLQNLNPAQLNTLMALAGTTGGAVPIQVQQQQGSDKEILMFLLKTVLEQKQAPPAQPAITLKDVADLLTAVKSSQPQPVAQSSASPIEILKLVVETTRPLYDQLNQKDKLLMDAKIQEIKNNMPGSLEDQINYVKEMAPILGLGGKATSELDLRMEEMKQVRELENKKIDWEQRKWEMESEQDNKKWDTIGKILQGPVGQALQNMGKAGADRIVGNKSQKTPTAVQTTCPNCNQPIWVDQNADTAICGNCGAFLQRQGPATSPPTASATHVDEPVTIPPPSAPATQPQEETQQEEEQGEEKEDGHNEPEGQQEEPESEQE